MKIEKDILERLANKVEKASRQCPPGMSVDSLRFRRLVRAIVNYENMLIKLRDYNLINNLDRFSPHKAISERVYNIQSEYNPIQIQDAKRRLVA